MGLQDPGLDPDVAQELRDVFGRLAFPRPGVITRVTGVDPDEVTADRDNLVVGGRIR
jgi:hypothetical protein